MKILMASGIQWDLADLTEEEKRELSLPSRVHVLEKSIGDESIEDYLSDEYFFCITGIEEVRTVSLDYCAIHIYGVKIKCDMHLRQAFDVLPNNDIYEIKDYVDEKKTDQLPQEYPRNARDIGFFYGGDDLMFIGYPAIMPYEMPRYTKKRMDKNIHDLLAYLYGEEIAETLKPDEIYEAWGE